MTVITEQSDSDLLQEFAAHRSQAAFTELVSRHSNWVYSAATRMVRDPHLAEDVAQAVFLVMADKAATLANVPLYRWLFKVTRYASANAIRARSRRDKYERLAAMSSSETQNPDPEKLWQEISPVLDDSIHRLRSSDRDALILRFYQQKSVAEVGAALGVSEGAAKIRILRAVDKLRGLLRRRGVTVPTDALSAAMLVRVTHAAPASVAKIAVPAAATVKATAISKGVTAMMISTKAKVAAIVILLASIPIGAGAIYMAATSSDRAVVAPQPASQAPADQTPQESAAPTAQAPAPAEQTFGFDPRVAPFITNRTDIIIVLDLTKIDLDLLAADMRTELGKMQLDAPSAAQLNGMIQMGDGAGKTWINGFKQAGGTTLYMLSRADELTVGGTPNAPSLRMTATLVYPADSPEAAYTLAKYLTSPGTHPPKVVGSTVVDRTSNPYTPPTEVQTDPRPSLAAALLAAGDSPIRAAANPLKLKEIMPKLMASGNVPMKLEGNEYHGVEYFSMKLVLPPAESPSLMWVSHHADAASAAAAATKATQRIADMLKSDPGTTSPLATQMRKFIATEKLTARDSDVLGTHDLHAYWRLIFTAVLSAHQPPATQPQAHPL